MTSMHDHTPLDAVDALFELRAQMAQLREREAELCDEIRSFATENGGEKVIGATRVAVIETRTPTRVDPAKLPHAILSDPHFFATEEETVVLLWPRPAVAQASHSEPVVLSEITAEPSATWDNTSEIEVTAEDTSADLLPEHAEALAPSEPEMAVVEVAVSAPETFSSETAGNSEDFSSITPEEIAEAEGPPIALPAEEDLLDTAEAFECPNHEDAPSEATRVDAPVTMRTIGVPVEEDGVSVPDISVAEESTLVTAEDNSPAALTMPEAEAAPEAFVSAEDPFGLKETAPQAPVMAPDMPLIDASGAEEGEAPKDLRPTEHAHLQPLAGLPDEDVAQMSHDSEDMLSPATLPDALDVAQALETQADQLADLPADVTLGSLTPPPTDFEDSDVMPATAFSSRRIAVGGET